MRSCHHLMMREVLRTEPLQVGETPCTVLSMVSHRDIVPYLVAIKTFARHARPRGIAALCDETVSSTDRATLRSQIPHVEFLDIGSFRHPGIPVGGCWERLLAVTELAKNRYVIQLDSDTVTTSDVREAVEATHHRSGFVMGNEPSQAIETLAALHAKTAPDSAHLSALHIHRVVQYHLSRVGLETSLMYTDGWASFTGFPPDETLQPRLFDVVARMRNALGRRFDDWGTEMVTSNFLVANAARCFVLPFPKYCTPVQGETAAHLWHFVGATRYDNFRYMRTSRAALKQLSGT